MSLVYPFEAAERKWTERKPCGGFKPPASDYEPLRKPGISSSSMSLIAPSLTVFEQLHEIFNDSLCSISSKCLQELSSCQELWNVEWSDITVRTDEKGSHQLFYHMHPITLEVCFEIVLFYFSTCLIVFDQHFENCHKCILTVIA